MDGTTVRHVNPWLLHVLERLDDFSHRLAALFSTQTRVHWLSVCERAEIPAGPVNTIREVFESDLGAAAVEHVTHPTAGSVPLVRSPLDVEGVATRRPPPLLGEHTVEVLIELGYPREDAVRMAQP